MGKIQEFEELMIQNGMSDADFEEYKKLLRRVPGNYGKQQHCYTTAIQFSKEKADQAIRLIQYGLEAYPDIWHTTYTSYLYIGKIYESVEKYQDSYAAYKKAMNELDEGQKTYRTDLAGHMFWVRLHIDEFQYSEELEELYLCYNETDEFSKNLINSKFRSEIAKLVILMYQNKISEARETYASIMRMCQPGYTGMWYSLLEKHRYREELAISSKTKKFLEKLKWSLR